MDPTRTASSSASAKASSSKAAGKRAAKVGQEDQAGEPAVLPMGKLLASTEKRTRDAAVRSLAAFLAQTGDEPISSLEMAKLWKGIFYCFWMSDKPLVQQALAQELADLVLTVPGTSRVPAPLVAGFDSSAGDISKRAQGGLAMLEGFWDAMAREWSGLDKWRINKFYLLLRRFLNAAFRLLSLEGWDPAAVDHLGRLLVKKAEDGKKGSSSSSGPLCANDVKVPDSLTYHLTDVWLDELERALASPPIEEEEEEEEGSKASKAKRNANFSLTALLKPMAQTAATCHSSTVFDKIMDNVLKPLLDDCLMVAAEDEEDAIADAEEEEDARRRTKRRKTTTTSPPSSDEEEKGSAAAYPSILSAARKAGQSPLALRASVYAMLFEAASREDALPQRRRRLYAFCQEERERREEVGEESGEE